MKWRLSAPARADLDGIWRYTNEQWNQAQADRYIDSLILRMVWLSENEALWMDRSDIRDGLYSVGESRHVIFFQSTGETISIVRVLHDRMDVARHIG